MAFGNGDRRAGRDASLGELVATATRDMSLLVRQEIDLAKAEMSRQATAAALSVGLIGAAAGLGLGALIALTIFFGELLTWAGLERFWSYLVTAVLLLVIAGLLVGVAVLRLRKLQPPARTISSVREDVAMLRHPAAAAGRGGPTPAPAVASIPPSRANGHSGRPARHEHPQS
ncbi:phage holin family protein [Frankia sp. CNm7]|uniref:Phage holin family protein n=1 Tax=Frankia nepalensis TaxID=1836974 RepID=A0A937RRX2_9ACTN|nr:phage holin family protein [Frankia nepalensis]MBL7496246.1 phage holin family protein [Frankia nepalensis]MBL7515582.1 phage holin family protein [Frankia nepalensis]MBL7521254.1 phage holin family protein [Frankia nepalensis]MBL7632244.1 phage holin family protein [Frankia nepalensis]